MLASCPKRQNGYPHLGASVLDGTKSQYDWEGLTSIDEYPFVINPDKGYFVTANNRIVPENSRFDHGASQISTPRFIRISEMIQDKINSNKRMGTEDMLEMMHDEVDIVARDLVPHIVAIARREMDNLGLSDQDKARKMVGLLECFKGKMAKDSVGASVYSYWQLFFYKSLFSTQTRESDPSFWTDEKVLLMMDDAWFSEFYAKLIKEISDKSTKYDYICRGIKSDGCGFSVAQAFADAYSFMVENFTDDTSKWTWGQLHYKSYTNSVFKDISQFNREVPAGGNGNTVSYSRYEMDKTMGTKKFVGKDSANFKAIFEFGDAHDSNSMSLDTGVNGNMFGGHYFDANADHT